MRSSVHVVPGSTLMRWILASAALFVFASASATPSPASPSPFTIASNPTIDGVWSELTPPRRSNPILGYDSGRLIVAGGMSRPGVNSPTLFSLDLSGAQGWSQLAMTGGYDGTGGSGFNDPARRRLLIIRSADVWVLDEPQLAWTHHAVPNPAQQAPYGIAFDSVRNRVLYVGAFYYCGDPPWHPETCYIPGVWSWPVDGDSALVEVTSPDPVPLNRRDRSAMFDPPRDRLIAFTDRFDNMRTLTFSDPPRWDSIGISGDIPDTASSRTSFYDPDGDLLVSYASPGDIRTLSLGSSPNWTRLLTTAPIPAADGAVTYDGEHRRILLQAGTAGAFWSYSLDSESWTPLVEAGPATSFHSMIVDRAADRLVVFGGLEVFNFGGTILSHNDVWTHSLGDHGQWRRMQTVGAPPAPRSWSQCVYDAANNRMIVFGGFVDDVAVNDTWSLSLDPSQTWQQLTFSGVSPDPRAGGMAVYDPVGHQMILFGGQSGSGAGMTDVWSLDLGPVPVWQPLTPEGDSPGPLYGQSAAYDSRRQRVLTVNPYDGTIWALSLAGQLRWDRIVTSGSNPTTGFTHCIYDPALDRLIESVEYSRDVYQLSLAQSPAVWTQLVPSGDSPGPRSFYPVAFDPTRGRMFQFGGQLGMGYVNDLFALQWATPPDLTPVPIPVATGELSLATPTPNPASSVLFASVTLPRQMPGTVQVLDVNGRRIVSQPLGTLGPGSHPLRIDVGTLRAGVYFIELRSGGHTIVQRFSIVR